MSTGDSANSSSSSSSETPFQDAAKTCRFPLDDSTAATITLIDGRKLGYCIYGSLSGPAVFYLHGLPTSRKDAASFDPVAKTLGLRIIAVDRPGIGLSTASPKRVITAHADEIRQLADSLQLDKYAVVGCSAGGPYALACALLLPADKLKAVSVVCGPAPPQAGTSGMQWRNRIAMAITPYAPSVLRWFYKMSTLGRPDLTDDQRFMLCKKQNALLDINDSESQDVLQDDDYLLVQIKSTREAFRQGFDAVVLDMKLLSLDWPFNIEDIRSDLSLELWYGRKDPHVPFHCGEYLAAKLGTKARFMPCDDGHLGVMLRMSPEWLANIAQALHHG